jgi:hypothetical protein
MLDQSESTNSPLVRRAIKRADRFDGLFSDLRPELSDAKPGFRPLTISATRFLACSLLNVPSEGKNSCRNAPSTLVLVEVVEIAIARDLLK